MADAPGPPSLRDHDSGEGMRSVEEARENVLAQVGSLAPIELPLVETDGCVLARDVVADLDLPTFASSAMDGFAVRASDVEGASPEGPVELPIVGRATIGQRPDAVVGEGEAVRIATGAPIPAGADAIVPVENTREQTGTVLVYAPSATGKHVRPAGEDVQAGQAIIPAGRKLGAPELGLLAAAGLALVPVYPRPRVVVLSTGDELVEPGKPTEFGQIHDSNAYAVAAALREAGAQPVMGGIVPDDVDALREAVVSHLAAADAFISSGGVSVGERDVVKAAFLGGGDVDFYRVAMQPGMPQAFGLIEGKPYWGLPGNPVSVFVSFEVFIRPAIVKMMGRRAIFRPEIPATLTQEISGPTGKTQFARVLVERDEQGRFTATPTGGRGSNLISTIARANGLAVIPAGAATVPAGGEVRVMVFRSMED